MTPDEVNVAAKEPCDHFFVYRVRGGEPISVGVCSFCGDINWPDLRQSFDEKLTAALAEAQRLIAELTADNAHLSAVHQRAERARADLATDLAEAQFREELMRPVVEAARAWRDRYLFALGRPGEGHGVTAQSRELVAAVDTYDQGGTDA